MAKEIVELVEQKVREINNEYYPKISPLNEEQKQLSTWLKNKPGIVNIPEQEMTKAEERANSLTAEIGRLRDEKRGRILELHQENQLVASSLEKLSKLRGGNFQKSSSRFRITTTTEAYSKKTEEGAYYCRQCKLWIVGIPRSGHLPGGIIFDPHDYRFCRICDSVIGMLTPETRRRLDRSQL